METSVKNVYSVGDCSGVAGCLIAGLEERIAGNAAAQSFGCTTLKEAKMRQDLFLRELEKRSQFRKHMDDLLSPRSGLYELANDETLICRCEEITLGTIKKIIKESLPNNINELKRMSRAGMGHCWNKMCGHIIQEIMAAQLGEHLFETGVLRPVLR